MINYGLNDHFVARRSWKYTPIIYSASLANEIFDFQINIDQLCDFFFNFEKQLINSRDISLVAYDYFVSQFTMNIKKFVSDRCACEVPDNYDSKVWGIIGKTDNGSEVSILPDVFKEVMKNGGFEDVSVYLKTWKSRGILNCEDGHLKRKRKILANAPAVKLYVIRMNDMTETC